MLFLNLPQLQIFVELDDPVAPGGLHPLQRAIDDQIAPITVDLEIDSAGETNTLDADVGDLNGIVIEAIMTKGERGGFRVGDTSAIDLEGGAHIAAEVGEGEAVGLGIGDAGGDADVE